MKKTILFLSLALVTMTFASCITSAVVGAKFDVVANETRSGAVSRTDVLNSESSIKCPYCYTPNSGSGLCSNCEGTGSIVKKIIQLKYKCPDCGGTGKCVHCGGTGYVPV